jgi:hypothetical protein
MWTPDDALFPKQYSTLFLQPLNMCLYPLFPIYRRIVGTAAQGAGIRRSANNQDVAGPYFDLVLISEGVIAPILSSEPG